MRILHARICDRLHGVCSFSPERFARRCPCRPGRQPVPLRHLCRHHARRRGRCPKNERRRLMPKYDWPAAEKRSHIGKRISRIDGPLKVTGAAKYSYDINRPGMLWARILGSPHAHAKVTSVDVSAAEALPGVKATYKD